MAGKVGTPVIAVFPDRLLAEAAVDELWHAGFPKNRVGFAAPGEAFHQASTKTEANEERAATGAVAGAATGTVLGALAGAVATVALPGLGAIITGGVLMGMGAATGAALGTFAGPFLAMGFSKEDVERYENDVRAGRSLVVVQTEDRGEEAVAVLRSHGAESVRVGGKAL
ncbi:MAG: general stress protein [Gemmataceae bacterium]|nr:general stress protein [Gemmataceae bacterium]